MPITIYGTDWCADTRRTRARLAGRGIRPVFIDIEARPELAAELIAASEGPLSIPIVIFDDGTRLDEPDDDELAAALADHVPSTVRHRTIVNRTERRFEQYRNDELVATAQFEVRSGTVVIVSLDRCVDDGGETAAHRGATDPDDDSLARLTDGLVEIVTRSGRDVDIDVANHRADDRRPSPPVAEPSHSTVAASTAPSAVAVGEAESCRLTKRFEALWSEGGDHRAATELAMKTGLGRLATIKALHALWEMPLTADAAALAFGDAGVEELAAMFHTLNWVIEQNPTSTMSELQAFDDATGLSVKTQALALAGRPRDTIAVVDRIGPGLHLHPISEATARSIAASAIREEDGQLRIQDRSTISHAFGWLFLYQSARYLDTGDYSAMISGNAPLLVDRFTGAIWVTGTEHRPDVYVDNYRQTGNPLAGRLRA